MAAEKTKRVRITKAVLVNGKHSDIGDEHDLPHDDAHSLVGAGTAVFADDEKAPPLTTKGSRTEDAENADPEAKHRDPTAQTRHGQGSARGR